MTLFPPPALFQVELTNHCNLDCAMCGRSSGLSRPLGHMDINLFRDIVDQSAYNDMPIHWLHHFGEPLLYPNLREALSYFRNKGRGLGGISTNALLLNEDKIDSILESCRLILCCVDSSVPEFYSKIRNNDHHERVCANVAKLIAERNKRGADCQIVIQLLRTRYNQAEDIQGLVKIFGNHPKLRYVEKRTDKHPDGADITVCTNPEDHEQKRNCPKARSELCILWNGTCLPCCWDADGLQPIGNIAHQPVDEIWQGTRHLEFQQQLADAKFEDLPMCNRCFGPITDSDLAYVGVINSWVDAWKKDKLKIVIAPGSRRMAKLLEITHLPESDILAFCDANPSIQGTFLDAIPVLSYQAIDSLNPDVIFIYSALHGCEIYDSLKHYRDRGIKIVQIPGQPI